MGRNGITAGPEKTTAGKRPSRPPGASPQRTRKGARACRALCRAREIALRAHMEPVLLEGGMAAATTSPVNIRLQKFSA